MTTEPATTARYGIQLPIQAQSNIFVQPWERTASPDDLAAIARTADETGFGYLAVCDHVAIPERLAPAMGTVWYDQIATLGWLAAITSRTHLLSHVHVLTYRHPAISAHAFATLDHLSGGRVVIGVGAGHVPEEFTLLDADFSRRGAILDERIGELATRLEHEFVDGFGASPRPVQQPRPPIWVGGSSPAAIRRAALLGDGWLPQGPPAGGMRQAIETIHALRDQHGRSAPFTVGGLTRFLFVGAPLPDDAGTPGEVLAGSAEQIAEVLRGHYAIGVTDLQVRFAARNLGEYLDQLRAFATDVAPHLG